jgi:hypothetical protein
LLLWSFGMWCHVFWFLVGGYQHSKGIHCLQKQVRQEKQQFSRVCGYLVNGLCVITSHKTAIIIMFITVRTSYTVTVSQMLCTAIGLAGKGNMFYLTIGCDSFSSKYFQVCVVLHKQEERQHWITNVLYTSKGLMCNGYFLFALSVLYLTTSTQEGLF